MMKHGVRTIGIDDGPFARSGRGDVLVAGAIYRGGSVFDGLLTTTVRKDGWNATDKILAMLLESKFLPQFLWHARQNYHACRNHWNRYRQEILRCCLSPAVQGGARRR